MAPVRVALAMVPAQATVSAPAVVQAQEPGWPAAPAQATVMA